MLALHFIAFPLRVAKRVMWLTDEVEKLEKLPISEHNAFGYTSSASRARHLPLKGKAWEM
jgi:hypothetical protein